MVLIKSSFNYEYLGGTIDDAVGEAFDKVARMLGLGYPGGPIISKLAQEAREDTKEVSIETGRELPRPMLHSGDYNFSFSGLKTAVLYKVKEIKERLVSDELPTDVQREIAREFEDSVAEVLASKMSKAMQEYNAETLIIGGGVAANSYINNTLRERLGKDINEVEILTPYKGLSGDNALMMAVAGYLRAERGEYIQDVDNLRANGTLKL
jgi:N6-L-threonylcarbamoyladenine synthase